MLLGSAETARSAQAQFGPSFEGAAGLQRPEPALRRPRREPGWWGRGIKKALAPPPAGPAPSRPPPPPQPPVPARASGEGRLGSVFPPRSSGTRRVWEVTDSRGEEARTEDRARGVERRLGAGPRGGGAPGGGPRGAGPGEGRNLDGRAGPSGRGGGPPVGGVSGGAGPGGAGPRGGADPDGRGHGGRGPGGAGPGGRGPVRGGPRWAGRVEALLRTPGPPPRREGRGHLRHAPGPRPWAPPEPGSGERASAWGRASPVRSRACP